LEIRASRERQILEEDMEKDTVGGVTGIDGYLFRLIATFEAAAMQQLGKIAHPLTGDVEVDLAGASDSIEMLTAIQRKTEGNLNDDEKRLLDHVLYQLRMNYVDVAADQSKEGTDESAKTAAPEEPGDGAADDGAGERPSTAGAAAGATSGATDEPAEEHGSPEE
jgi:hypothetical protein